jgi:hypothetical protein
MIKFFHHLFNPHCIECRDEYLDSKICDSCNTLRQEIIALRKHNQQLIDAILDKVRTKEEVIPQAIIQPEAVNKNLSWRARRQILETEDRKTAEIMRQKTAEMAVDKLEKELEINDAI